MFPQSLYPYPTTSPLAPPSTSRSSSHLYTPRIVSTEIFNLSFDTGCYASESFDANNLEQMDVKKTFLYGDLEKLVYMLQLEGFIQPGQEHLVYKLKKSLYGLKQSPRLSLDDDSSFIFLLLYVDDMLIVVKSMVEVNKLKSLLSKEFDMKDLGATKKIIGMEIHRDRALGRLWLSQHNYVKRMLERFNMDNAKPVPYASAVGCLMYAMVCTRLVLAHAINYGITFSKQQSDPSVKGYVDADYAGDLDERRSTIVRPQRNHYDLCVWSRSWVFNKVEFNYILTMSAIYLEKPSISSKDQTHRCEVSQDRELVSFSELFLEKVHTSENAADMLTKHITT
ncbi:hypothetical protein AAG906_012015 [Vitis piasezkii]